MRIGTAIANAFRATDLDKIRESPAFTKAESSYWTKVNNRVNAGMYAANALFPVTGVLNAVVGTLKMCLGMFAHGAMLGASPESEKSLRTFAADMYKSGAENFLVGAVAALFPGPGQVAAGAMAARSVVDRYNA